MIAAWLENMTVLLEQGCYLAPFLALLAGMLTSLSPCSLSMLPLAIGYVGGGAAKGWQAFGLSVTFAVGTAISMTALGIAAALAGHVLSGIGRWWYVLAGVLLILMALQIWELYVWIPPNTLLGKSKVRGYGGALLAGLLGGLCASSCATPVLMALLTVVASQDNLAWGILLLFCYALGNGILIVILGTCLGAMQQFKQDRRYLTFSRVVRFLLGAFVLLLGFWFFYLAF